ncbi:MAG: TIGR03013 family XrtA/PEP-CTERM system glycosyltransferase [Pseudomonadota bacterium]
MGLFAPGSQIRNQLVLMGGDALTGLFILFPVIMSLNSQQKISPWVMGFIPTLLLSAFLCEVYKPGQKPGRETILRTGVAAGLALIPLVLLVNRSHDRYTHVLLCLIVFMVLQNLWQGIFHKSSASAMFARNILVIGTGPTAKKIESLVRDSHFRYSLKGYIRTATDPISVDKDLIMGPIDDIVSLARTHDIHAIVIALTERRGNLMIDKLVTCKLMGVRIIDYPTFFETMTGKLPVEDINPSWLVQSNGFLITPFIRIMKRIIDIVFATIGLACVLPFFPLVALLIKLDSPGPVFYLQERVGANSRHFIIIKFRSMTQDAEKETGAAWALENDPRITSLGAFMRKTRIDELPQLVNVLKGDMSFIGPRPERPEFVEQISKVAPYYLERHAVKPGITGWAQVMYPYGASLGDSVEKLRYDLYYINNLSFFLDILIVLETVKVVLFRKGGR